MRRARLPGDTRQQRAWFRDLVERAGAEHELHVIEAFDAITAHFQPPSADEGFTVVRHQRD